MKQETFCSESEGKSAFSIMTKAHLGNKYEMKKRFPNEKNSDIKNIKVKKSVHLKGPIFNLKYSSIHPNILASCSQDGWITIVNTDKEIESIPLFNDNNSNELNANNNTNVNNQILPDFNEMIHNNSVYGLDWSLNDTRILTGGSDCLCKMTNLSSDNLGVNEAIFIGHYKTIKWLSQSPFNDHLSASCGRDEVIYIWDIRTKNAQYCNGYCKSLPQGTNHIHPIGAFSNKPRNLTLIKKRSINTDTCPNTFTAVDFLSEQLILSTETNNEDMKVWDMRKMINNDLDQFTNEQKYSKKFIEKLEENKYIAGINRYTYIYTKYLQIKDKHSLSSKYNTSESGLFGLHFLVNNTNITIANVTCGSSGKGNSNQRIINGTLDNFAKGITIKKPDIKCNNSPFQDNKQIKYLDQFNYKNVIEAEREINLSTDIIKEKEMEELNQLKAKIKELKSKKVIKGLTSININRFKKMILVNSISNTQYVYDALFMAENQPIELKGNVSSSYFVKSVLSHCGQYVLSGSSTPNLCIWDINVNKEADQTNASPIKLVGYHKSEINAVDWSRNMSNFIATACDSGLILIWNY